MDGSVGFESFMKIGDLIKVDYAGWAIAEESEHFYDVVIPLLFLLLLGLHNLIGELTVFGIVSS